MTVVLVGLCWAVFLGSWVDCLVGSEARAALGLESLWSMGACTDALVDVGAMALGRVWVDGQWWRVATTGLVHGSWLHVILNTWSLWVVGPWVERAVGWPRMLLIFGLSSLGGCLASLAWAEATMAVGASAGIVGLAASLWVFRVRGIGAVAAVVEPVSAQSLGLTLVVLLGMGLAIPVIAQAGHLGGLVVGAALGWVMRGVAGSTRTIVLSAGIVAGFTAGVALAMHAQWRPRYPEIVGFRLLELEAHAEAAAHLEDALARQPDAPELKNAVAYAYAEAGIELARAEVLVVAALAAEPNNADYLDTQGWIFCRQGDVRRGLELLREAAELSAFSVPEMTAHLETCEWADVSRGTPRHRTQD